MKDHVWGHALLFGQFRSLGLELMPQGFFHRCLKSALNHSFNGRLEHFILGVTRVLSHPYLLLAFEHGSDHLLDQPKPTIIFYIGFQETRCNQLAKNAAPLRQGLISSDSKGTHLLMLELCDARGDFSHQDIDQVSRPKTLTSSVYAGQGFLSQETCIPSLHWLQTVVAIAT